MSYAFEYYASDAVFPAPGDVEAGSGDYGPTGADYTPTFAVPPESKVEDGYGYGADETEFEGSLTGGGITLIDPGSPLDPMLYRARTGKVELTRLSDYKTGTPPGPLLIPMGANGVAEGDAVAFGAQLCDDSVEEQVHVTGAVIESGGSYYAKFEIEGATDLNKTASPFWRWGMEHTNGSGDVSSVVSDKEMELLPDRVVSE